MHSACQPPPLDTCCTSRTYRLASWNTTGDTCTHITVCHVSGCIVHANHLHLTLAAHHVLSALQVGTIPVTLAHLLACLASGCIAHAAHLYLTFDTHHILAALQVKTPVLHTGVVSGQQQQTSSSKVPPTTTIPTPSTHTCTATSSCASSTWVKNSRPELNFWSHVGQLQ
eukprot:1141174-Pelagomonas_calceolata.AAC.10